ncbi:ATP-binding protein [Methylacidimicrobium tartarophylax]|uniref:ATP-binding protein n=1 Tax=Methylacidimicrobium tartarophylax TaxID=1041768 RepID=UPI00406BB013
MCAFANDLPDRRKPGVIFVGVEDEGACAHLKITDRLLRDFAQMRDDGNILPFPYLIVAKHPIGDCEVATIEVAPADNPPIRYNGRVWIRMGPRRAQAAHAEEFCPGRRPDDPLVALQQLARNLPMHRSDESTNAPSRIYWFSDRIEFDSPSGLYGRVSPENFGTGITDYRNPLLAEGIKVLGYVQRFGLGIPLTEEALRKNGNAKPEYRFELTHLLTILRRRS